MRTLGATLVLLSAGLLAGCQAGSDSASASQGARSGGILNILRPDPVTLPEGAAIHLVLETAISSKTSRLGDVVVARVAEAVRVGEKVVVPAGTEVHGTVTAAVPSGRVKTRARLAVDFDTLVVGGKEHSIGTRQVDITAHDTHKKDALIVGGGAGAGALIGALTRGGKGAGIGALIGGAAGTGVVLVDTGKEVELGPGAHVTVTLAREAHL
jgi:hypothetical protein